ncbi:MAG: hypothetical protein A2054_08005 [Deltaproteobacteria bacterium GWA2_55_10]|nr:MAG: hypothetical protein A2054_08005 [Deltaproteobacteria bacterium GWA2_55_10]
MFIWAVILLAVNVAFMSGILYILLFRRGGMNRAPDSSMGDALLADLKKELNEVRAAASQLGSDFERYGRKLSGRTSEIEEMIRKVQAAGREEDIQRLSEDVYSKALRMHRSGVPASDVAKSLGLLNGEAELLFSLKRM